MLESILLKQFLVTELGITPVCANNVFYLEDQNVTQQSESWSKEEKANHISFPPANPILSLNPSMKY